ncbi:MAG: hypothetical protein WA751_04610 [Candidatus Dormiibacterota bacterium]
MIPALRQTASVLIAHGYGHDYRDWMPADKRLFEAFLGRPVEIEGETVAGKWLWHDSADGRLVVYMDAPSGSVSHAYLEGLRELAQGACPRSEQNEGCPKPPFSAVGSAGLISG